MTPSFGKAYLIHSFIDLSDCFALDAQFEALQKKLEVQRQ